MGALSKILRSVEGGGLMFWCPGCDSAHMVRTGEGPGPRWGWNGDAERPTFTPSILVQYDHWVPPVTPENHAAYKAAPWPQTRQRDVCHSFVEGGRIRFLSDCTHHLAGQTVDLPAFDEEERAE